MTQIAINDIGSTEDFIKAIDQSIRIYKKGDIARGYIIDISRDGALVDIGQKTEAFIPMKEITSDKDFDIKDYLQIGQEIEALVLSKNEEGNITLSLKQTELEKTWEYITNCYEISQPIRGLVTKIVKGGLIVDVGVRSFLPLSQIDLIKVDNVEAYLGQEIDVLIINVDREKSNIVLSRRALLEQINKEEKFLQFAKMAIGQVHKGIVSGIASYGAFIQIGHISGLIHTSKMNGKTLQANQEVDVEVIDIDLEKSRLSLALRG